MNARVENMGAIFSFWSQLEEVRARVKEGGRVDAAKLLASLAIELSHLDERTAINRLRILKRFAVTYRLDCAFPELESAVVAGTNLDDYVKSVIPGVSLVTCCKNRNENLLKALPSWLACPEISEIVIVDWSSDIPVRDELNTAGVDDARVKIVWVENESRWVLTYAFNVGFRAARYDKILKVDADIVLSRDFFRKNDLAPSTFISGDWRIAEAGQEFINGFFYLHRSDLMNVKGFNEFITTYGWDDDDIYHRLESSGVSRERVDPATIFHLPHDDAQRIGGNSTPAENAWDELSNETRFKIRTNRFIANTMPTWNEHRRMLPYVIEDVQPDFIQIRRNGKPTHPVPGYLQAHAEFYAASELLSWSLGPRVLQIPPEQLRRLLSCRKFEEITKLDIELVLSVAPQSFRFASAYLLVRASWQRVIPKDRLTEMEERVREYSYRFGLPIVVVADSDAHRKALLQDEASIGSWARGFAGEPHVLRVEDLILDELPEIGRHVELSLNDESFVSLDKMAGRHLGPAIATGAKRIFVDAQHGLGNRLRAIASGAAIAEKTGRELVIVWEPDHHCDCRFHDLFEYSGAVIEESFISTARNHGAQVFNYMEIEKDAQKDAPIEIDEKRDLYFRSAYVAKSSLTDWSRENAFLRALKPSAHVLDLVAQVRQPNAVGAHVRMEAGKGLDHNTYDSPENWTREGHEQLHYWRAQSHYSRFMRRIDQLESEDLAPTIFLAADRPEIYEEFITRYGDRLAYLKREVYDRSREQIQYALADVLLLSRCERLLGSTWSSFSELALRLSDSFESIEMSGKEF